ncbi:MAG TPA: heavy metal transporter [Firmicutes bacterium]|nr:heavy metal transporter [Bacillota bacterium]
MTTQLLGIGLILLAFYVMIKKTVGFNFIPEVNQSMGYGLLLLTGLVTSLHCIAMCGGLNLSQCVTARGEDGRQSQFERLRPSLLYNGGRVLSYTVLGGLVGALGSVISFSGPAKGMVAIIAGGFMVILGLNMLDLFPWLRKLSPRLPRLFGKQIAGQPGKYGPLYVGLLNGLMPCGPLQAMQLYALGTGSFTAGALSMLVFSIGTVPLMFSFGAVSSMLSRRFTRKMMQGSALLIVMLGLVMTTRGLALSGLGTGFPASASGNIARIQGNVQVVTTEMEPGRYVPIVVQKGIPVKWTIRVEPGDLNGCNNPITIPKYGIQKRLTVGDNLIEFTPEEEGTIIYTCWMGMIRSTIKVVPDLAAVSEEELNAVTNGGDPGANWLPGGNGIPTDKIGVGEIKDGVQYITLSVQADRLSPAVLVLERGVPTKWVINGETLSEENSGLILPEYRALLQLKEGKNEIQFTPVADFTLLFLDGTLQGYVKVVPSLERINLEAIKNEVENYQPVSIGSGGGASCH